MLRVIQGTKTQDQSPKRSNILDINNRLRQKKLKVVETKAATKTSK